MKKGAIFDMDGLLFDTERLYQAAWKDGVIKRGYEPHPDFQKRIMGSSGADIHRIITELYPGIDSYELALEVLNTVQTQTSKTVPEKPGVHEILSWMDEQDMRIAIASASPPDVIARYTDLSKITQHFDALVSSYDVKHGKPAPDVFLKAADAIGLPPEDCYVFEDGINGIKAAFAAGCAAVMIPDLAEPPEDFYGRCAAILPSLSDALELIKSGKL